MSESRVPSVEVAVCMAESSFTQVTVSPTLASIGFGLYELFPALSTIVTVPSAAGDEFCSGFMGLRLSLLLSSSAKFGMLVRTEGFSSQKRLQLFMYT